MRKQILEELKEMRYLFNYDRGKIISEQNQNLNEMINLEKGSFSYDLEEDAFGAYEDNLEEDAFGGDYKDDLEEDAFGGDYKDDLEEEIDFYVPTMMPGTKEKERTITKPGTKPDKDSPYKPKPGPKKNPKAKKGDMPDWITFDKIGINFKQK
jgi:hypothetical protein